MISKMTKVILILCSFCMGCKAQSNEEKMKATTLNLLNAIKNENKDEFVGLMWDKIVKDGKERLYYDLSKYHKYYNFYFRDSNPQISNSKDAHILSMRKIVIPFYKGEYDSVNNLTGLTLELYFGPPQMVPLSKISRYEMIVEGRKKGDIFVPPVRTK